VTYQWLTWLPAALRDAGCRVVTVDGWQTRGRPSSTGDFDPYAVLWHHTGTTTSRANPAPTLGMCIKGRSDLTGPLCQVLIGYDGTCHVIAAGRANHAGACNGNGPTRPGDGNAQMVGFEIDYNGTQPMSGAQYDAAIKAAAAVVAHYGNDERYCRGHKETSETGKWDPGGYSMDTMRADVRTALRPKGDDDMPEYLSLGGPGFTLNPGRVDDWTEVNYNKEFADPGNVHTDDKPYPWLKLAGAKYQGMVVLNDVDANEGTVLIVRWAEYAVSDGVFKNAVGPVDYVLPDRTLSIHDQVIDACGPANKVTVQVRALGGPINIGSVGVRALYWK
jgi:hypothetical protein